MLICSSLLPSVDLLAGDIAVFVGARAAAPLMLSPFIALSLFSAALFALTLPTVRFFFALPIFAVHALTPLAVLRNKCFAGPRVHLQRRVHLRADREYAPALLLLRLRASLQESLPLLTARRQLRCDSHESQVTLFRGLKFFYREHCTPEKLIFPHTLNW